MTYPILRNEKQSKEEESLPQQQLKPSEKCSNLKIWAIIAAWISLVIPLYSLAEIVFYLSRPESRPSVSVTDIIFILGYFVMYSVFLGITVVNIYAVHKDKSKYMKPWLAFTALFGACSIIEIMFSTLTVRKITHFYESPLWTFTVIRVISFIIIYNHFCNIINGPSNQKHCSIQKITAIISAWIAIIIPVFFFISKGDYVIEKMLNDIFVYDRFTLSSIAGSIVMMVVLSVILGLSIANIYGVHKENLKCIRLWLLGCAFSIAIFTILTIYNLIIKGYISDDDNLFFYIIVVYSICFTLECKYFRKIKSSLFKNSTSTA